MQKERKKSQANGNSFDKQKQGLFLVPPSRATGKTFWATSSELFCLLKTTPGREFNCMLPTRYRPQTSWNQKVDVYSQSLPSSANQKNIHKLMTHPTIPLSLLPLKNLSPESHWESVIFWALAAWISCLAPAIKCCTFLHTTAQGRDWFLIAQRLADPGLVCKENHGHVYCTWISLN